MRAWRRATIAIAVALLLQRGAAVAGEPDAETLQKAHAEFDAGARQLKAQEFEQAAAHFEAAFAAVASPRALRNAIRARVAADQPARASTLSALAKRLYPGDAETAQLADEVLGKNKGGLGRATVTCASPCALVIGKHAVPGGASKLHVVYFTPGEVKLRAALAGGVEQARAVQGSAGQDVPVDFIPSETDTAAVSDPAAGTSDEAVESPDRQTEAVPAPAPAGDETAPASPDKEPEKGEPGARPWYRAPALFYVSLGATAVLAGTTVWSGVDTLNNPGRDAVRAACAGQGTDCPLYQQGVANQVRTDALIGASAGMGLVTLIIGAALTDFGHKPAPVGLTAHGLSYAF